MTQFLSFLCLRRIPLYIYTVPSSPPFWGWAFGLPRVLAIVLVSGAAVSIGVRVSLGMMVFSQV